MNAPTPLAPDEISAAHSVTSVANPSGRHGWLWFGVLLLVAATVVYYFFGKSAKNAGASLPAKKGGGTIPVIAASAIKGNIGVYLTGLGSVTPLYRVTLKPRVDGQLVKVFFEEGQVVKEGDPLVEIDPRPYQVLVTQAEGQLLREQADLKNARADLDRYKTLWEQRAIPQQTLSAQEAIVAGHEGTVKSDEAQLDNAKLNLAYSHITAPISGRVGLRQVDPGNMIHASDSGGLLTITQVQPITTLFSIPQDALPPVLKKLRGGQKLIAEAYDREQKTKLAQGSLLTVDNQIDASTGTLKCKAIFTNDDEALFPNQFVNIRLLVEMREGVTLVPNAAIQRGSQQSTFVYIVSEQPASDKSQSPDQVVSVRPVTLGTSEGDVVEIQNGLQPGDVVVLEGVDRLQSGSKVTVRMKGAESPVKTGESPTAPAGNSRKKKP